MNLIRIAVTVLVAGGIVHAQTQAGAQIGPEFEVASVKPFAGGGRGGPQSQDAGQFSWQGAILAQLIARAYGGDEVIGPDGINSERYSVSAKIPAGAAKEDFETMLQNLLAERFRLAIHREMKVVDAYDLVLAKGGPKLKASVAAESGVRGLYGSDGATIAQSKVGMPQFTNFLAMRIRAGDLPDSLGEGSEWPRVVDKTGLTGIYDISLHYALPRSDTPGEDLFGALQSQLGLSLKPTKISVEMVIVDHAEKIPTGN